jgi:hypothetical protein
MGSQCYDLRNGELQQAPLGIGLGHSVLVSWESCSHRGTSKGHTDRLN